MGVSNADMSLGRAWRVRHCAMPSNKRSARPDRTVTRPRGVCCSPVPLSGLYCTRCLGGGLCISQPTLARDLVTVSLFSPPALTRPLCSCCFPKPRDQNSSFRLVILYHAAPLARGHHRHGTAGVQKPVTPAPPTPPPAPAPPLTALSTSPRLDSRAATPTQTQWHKRRRRAGGLPPCP